MLYINNATSPYNTQRVTLGDTVVDITFKYNSRNASWYMTVRDINSLESLVEGVKLEPNQNLTGRYNRGLIKGDIYCMRVKNDFNPIGYSNLGENLTYRIAYLSDEEKNLLGIEDVIQLP